MCAAILFLVLSAGSLSVAPFLFGKVINYAVPGQSNWYVGGCIMCACSDEFSDGLYVYTFSTDKYGRNIPPNVTNCMPYTMGEFNKM